MSFGNPPSTTECPQKIILYFLMLFGAARITNLIHRLSHKNYSIFSIMSFGNPPSTNFTNRMSPKGYTVFSNNVIW